MGQKNQIKCERQVKAVRIAQADCPVSSNIGAVRKRIVHMSDVWSRSQWNQLGDVIVGNQLHEQFPRPDLSTQLAKFPVLVPTRGNYSYVRSLELQ